MEIQYYIWPGIPNPVCTGEIAQMINIPYDQYSIPIYTDRYHIPTRRTNPIRATFRNETCVNIPAKLISLCNRNI